MKAFFRSSEKNPQPEEVRRSYVQFRHLDIGASGEDFD